MLSTCPFCNLDVPAAELEWHANSHFEDEMERDLELAIQIAMAPPSPKSSDKSADDNSHTVYSERTPKTYSPGYNSSTSSSDHVLDQKVSSLIGLQVKSTLYKFECGLMNLLRYCLDVESVNFRSIISGHVDHYQSNPSDFGWGCGWRNIQMLSSHLLMQRLDARNAMFGGSGFIPDITSLQRWLEIAWEKGFDAFGAESFGHKIIGSRKWIGTTECATLLRSFGLRARIVDFDSKDCSNKLNGRHPRSKMKEKPIYGPMDRYLVPAKHDRASGGPSSNDRYTRENNGKDDPSKGKLMDQNGSKNYQGKVPGCQVLVQWVWNYFTSEFSNISDNSESVLISEKSPLYFQHQGHSRTIVGIQKQRKTNGTEDCYFLLVLDPGHKTTALDKSLRENNGWQKLIKRGVHTLKKPQYQLCYVDPGITDTSEIEQLKIVDSILVEI